jgi:HlyD family secretion protein
VSIDNPGKELKANMTANAEIVLEEHPTRCSSSRSATTTTTKNASVDVIAPGAPNGRRKTPIKVGVGNGTKIEVLEGLKPGQKLLLPG